MIAEIREMTESDRESVLKMMRVFYASDAVYTCGGEEIFNNDISFCVKKSPYLEGYVFVFEKKLIGYGMIAKSFSTEFGKQCVWLEDIYITESYRGLGVGRSFLEFLDKKYPSALKRLEVENENVHAVNTYAKNGYKTLPYKEMYKL